ncbi:MAG: hypothetical protein J6S85_12715 [Methanobrevibacter sp.]|nr:hypothetical protein [Methanobrevibacter sp.]
MLNDVTWRKLPIDLLTNENFTYAESFLKEEEKYAPYMFYITALRKVDNDGIFDLEDGVIFARLMRVQNPQLVFDVANLLLKRHVIARVDDSNKCLIVDWEYPAKEPPRSLAQRRDIVREKIEREKKLFANNKEFGAENNKDFFCAENDKNQDNVVKNIYDDKNQKNVVIKEQTEREKERLDTEENLKDREKETHTEQKEQKARDIEIGSSSATLTAPLLPENKESATVVANETQNENRPEDSEKLSVQESNASSTEGEMQTDSTQIENEEHKAVYDVLNKFFAKNCYGYNPKMGTKILHRLSERITALADEENPGETIANVICQKFLAMNKDTGHWRDIPLFPTYMEKPAVWAVLLTHAGKILKTSSKQNKFFDEAAKFDQKKIDELRVENDKAYVELGIDPNGKNAITQLLAAKAQEQRKTEESDGSEQVDYDIF